MSVTSLNGAVTPTREGDLLDGLEGALRAQLDQLGAERNQLVQDHKRRLSRLDHEIVRYNRVLRAVDPEAPKPGPKRRSRAGGTGVSDMLVRRAARTILLIETETFTVRDANDAAGISPKDTKYYGAFNRLRDMEIIAKAGHTTGDGNRRGGRQMWRVMPDGREKLEAIANG